MKNLVTFTGRSKVSDSTLVGIALTDEILEHLKEKGAILQTADRTGSGVDILLLYAPTLNEVMQKAKAMLGKEKMEVKII